MEMNMKYYVKLNREERRRVHQVRDAAGTSKTVRKRCEILLLADENVGMPISQAETAVRCGVSVATVQHTVKDYHLKGLEFVLRRRTNKEPKQNPIVTEDTEKGIIALARTNPPEGSSRWTVRLLTKKVIEREIVPTIGRETIRKLMKKHCMI